MAATRGSSFQDNVIKGMMPNVKDAQTAQYQYLQQLMKRVGGGPAMRLASQAVAPFAEQAAQKAGDLSMAAAKADEQRRQYEESLKQRQKEFEVGSAQWEKSFAQQQKNQELLNQLAIQKQTGAWTPEMLDLLGLSGVGRGDMRDVQRQLELLGIGGMGTTGSGNRGAMMMSGRNPYGSIYNAKNNWGGKTGLIYA